MRFHDSTACLYCSAFVLLIAVIEKGKESCWIDYKLITL